MDAGQPAMLRQWVENQRAAAEVVHRLEREAGPRPTEAIASALALVRLYSRLHGWPPAPDPVEMRGDREMYETWSRLRRRLTGREDLV